MFHCPVGIWVIEQRAIILNATVRSPTVMMPSVLQSMLSGWQSLEAEKEEFAIPFWWCCFPLHQTDGPHKPGCHWREVCIWVRSRRSGCLVNWFCYHLIAKPGNKTAAPSWPDPYATMLVSLLLLTKTRLRHRMSDMLGCSMSSLTFWMAEQWALWGSLNCQPPHSLSAIQIRKALSKMKCGKSAGPSGIIPEMLKAALIGRFQYMRSCYIFLQYFTQNVSLLSHLAVCNVNFAACNVNLHLGKWPVGPCLTKPVVTDWPTIIINMVV